ncbi:hypothetical protein NFJ02_15g22460 [Pycnococcus provasolii]
MFATMSSTRAVSSRTTRLTTRMSRRRAASKKKMFAISPQVGFGGGGGGGNNNNCTPRFYGGNDGDDNNSGRHHPISMLLAPVLLYDIALTVKCSKPTGDLMPNLLRLIGCIMFPPLAVYFGRGKGGRKLDKYFWVTTVLLIAIPILNYFGFAASPIAQLCGLGSSQIHAILVTLFHLSY